MASFQVQGREWLARGEKKLKSLGWFGNKYEEAAECFEKAANQFKLAKSCRTIVFHGLLPEMGSTSWTIYLMSKIV